MGQSNHRRFRDTRPMPDETAYDAVHARLLDGFPELVGELGGNMQTIDCPASTVGAGGHKASYREIATLLNAAARQLDCPDFGMRLASRQHSTNIFGPLGQAMRNSRNFGEALNFACEHIYAHSLAARIWLGRHANDRQTFAGHDILIEGVSGREQAIEHILLIGNLLAMELTGGRARARRIHFRHAPIASTRSYYRFFGCDISFGQASDGMVFDDDDLAARIIAPDNQALKDITAYIDRQFTRREPPFHAQVRAVILRLLATGNCSTEQVARTMCMHVRALHRRLSGEGTSFRLLKDELRRDLLQYYLDCTDLDLSAISERLGFAEQSVLSRYCRRSFGASPGELRRRST